MVADAGDEPADAGEVVSDAGESAADAAGAVDDAGDGVEDAGAIVRDSGVVPRDTGVVARTPALMADTGVVPRDTGAARDTGVVRDSGVVARDTGVVADAGAFRESMQAVYNLMRSRCLGCHRNRGRGGFGLGNGSDGDPRRLRRHQLSRGALRHARQRRSQLCLPAHGRARERAPRRHCGADAAWRRCAAGFAQPAARLDQPRRTARSVSVTASRRRAPSGCCRFRPGIPGGSWW